MKRILTFAAAVAVLALGGWSFTLRPAPTPTTDGTVAMPGGAVHVEAVREAVKSTHAMPGMGSDNDPVPAGSRRVTVEVTLVAAEDESMPYAVDRFALDLGGAGRVTPHSAVMPGRELPAGTSMAAALTFDVPESARAAVLTFEGSGATEVAIPAGSAPGAHQDHTGPATQ